MLPTNNRTTSAHSVNPQDPSTWLKPGDVLIGADGRDWSWAYVWFEDVKNVHGWKASHHGNIWSCRKSGPGSILSTNWKRLNPTFDKNGYLYVNTGQRKVFVHTLVLEAFGFSRPPDMECRHLDGDPANNRLHNLKWGTAQENSDDRLRHGTRVHGESNGNSRLTDDLVREAIRLADSGMTYREIGRRIGVSDEAAAKAIKGILWKHVERPSPLGRASQP